MSCDGFCTKTATACSDCRLATMHKYDGFYSAGEGYGGFGRPSFGSEFTKPSFGSEFTKPSFGSEITKAFGAIPGGWSTAEWATLTTDQKIAVQSGDATTQAQIREAIQAGAKSAVDLLVQAIKTAEAAADRAGATEIEQIRARNALELAKIQAATQIELAKLGNRQPIELTPVKTIQPLVTPPVVPAVPAATPVVPAVDASGSSGVGMAVGAGAVLVGLYFLLK